MEDEKWRVDVFERADRAEVKELDLGWSDLAGQEEVTVSVFITSYNQKEYLTEAIDSVLAQTLKPHQIVIVDDCSTDGSRDLIHGYCVQHPNVITALFHEKNTGVAKVRIDALNAVTGEYISYLDGDDRFLPSKLEQEFLALRKEPNAQIAYSNNFYMTTSGEHTGTWCDEEKPPVGHVFKETFAREFPKRSLFRMEFVNYSAWKSIGFHDPHLILYEDFDMRIRLTNQLNVVYHDEPLSEIRIHGKGLSSSSLDHHLDALRYIFRKNRRLLENLTTAEKRWIEKKYYEFVAGIEREAAIQSIRNNRRLEGVRLLLQAFLHNASITNLVRDAKLLFPTNRFVA